ncbi:Uncharacterised protein [Shigella sonnei]|nr:Uncharacterised protein [Shigella sonnei]
MFQRNVFGFRYQPQCQQDKQYVQSRIHPEGVGVTQRVEHGQERCANDHVGNPVGGSGAGDAKIAAFQRLNFGAQYPNQRTGTHGKTDNKHQQHGDGEILRRRRVDTDMHHCTEYAHASSHHQEAQR